MDIRLSLMNSISLCVILSPDFVVLSWHWFSRLFDDGDVCVLTFVNLS